MTDQTTIEVPKSWLQLSDALVRASQKFQEVETLIFQGYRQILDKGRVRGRDMAATQFAVDASDIVGSPEDPRHNRTRINMVRALMEVWYRANPRTQSNIFDCVREIAVLNKRNLTAEVMNAQLVLSGAKTAGEALSEQYEVNKAAAAKRRQERDDKELQAMQRRLLGAL